MLTNLTTHVAAVNNLSCSQRLKRFHMHITHIIHKSAFDSTYSKSKNYKDELYVTFGLSSTKNLINVNNICSYAQMILVHEYLMSFKYFEPLASDIEKGAKILHV